MIFPLLALLGLGLLYSQRGKASAPSRSTPEPKAAPIANAAARIIRESKEILDGKRDAYSDPDVETAAELAKAQAAAKIAQARETGDPAPGSGMARQTSVDIGPAEVRPAAAPAGTDLALAKSTAPKVAAHLKQKGRAGYSRQVLRLWQGRAGIAPDGIYGRGAAAALKYFTPSAPGAFFAQGVAKYQPPAG